MMEEIQIRTDEWRPRERVRWRFLHNLTAGQLIIWERRPYRVIEVRERDHIDWPDDYRTAWIEAGMPDPAKWEERPMSLVLQDEEKPKAKPLHLITSMAGGWQILPEHYALCRLCGELPPCRHVHNEAIAERAGKRFEEEMAILPGMCHACREPITQRQKSVRFTGPNLIRPDLGDDSAVFHLRSKCWGSVYAYDIRWAEATGKPRRFHCDGSRTVHHDQSQECTNPVCPGDVYHAMSVWHYPGVNATYRGCWCLVDNLLPAPKEGQNR
jgi:hypothetical protein